MSPFLIVFGSLGLLWLVAVGVYVCMHLREHVELEALKASRISHGVILPPPMTKREYTLRSLGANRKARRAHASKPRDLRHAPLKAGAT